MSLGTIIHSGLVRPSRPLHALVLMGGGARTAYQVGVLQALGAMLQVQPAAKPGFPFQVLVGTSAGALNVAYLASTATKGLDAFKDLAHFWSQLQCDDVYALDVPPWVRISRPSVSSPMRSLRMVTAETLKRVASSPTRTRPCSSTMRTMCSCRSRAKTSPGEALAGTVTPLLRAISARVGGFVWLQRHSKRHVNAMSR